MGGPKQAKVIPSCWRGVAYAKHTDLANAFGECGRSLSGPWDPGSDQHRCWGGWKWLEAFHGQGSPHSGMWLTPVREGCKPGGLPESASALCCPAASIEAIDRRKPRRPESSSAWFAVELVTVTEAD